MGHAVAVHATNFSPTFRALATGCLRADLVRGLLRWTAFFALALALGMDTAHAVSMSRNAALGMARAYGYVFAQEESLRAIEQRYPDLATQVKLARLGFSSAFPSVIQKMEAQFSASGGSDVLRDMQLKMGQEVRQMLTSQSLTRDTAIDFLERVARRTKGQDMSEEVRSYLLAVAYEDSPDQEFSAGFRQRYSTEGHGKSLGLRVRLQAPSSWKAQEGERPHIVQKWTSEGGTGLSTMMIQIRNIPETPNHAKVASWVARGEVKDFIPDGQTLVSSKATRIDGEPALMFETKGMAERAGMHIYQRTVSFMAFFRNRTLLFQCGVGAQDTDVAKADALMERNRRLCTQVANSIVFDQRY